MAPKIYVHGLILFFKIFALSEFISSHVDDIKHHPNLWYAFDHLDSFCEVDFTLDTPNAQYNLF